MPDEDRDGSISDPYEDDMSEMVAIPDPADEPDTDPVFGETVEGEALDQFPAPDDGITPGDSDGSALLDERYKQDFDGLMYLGYLTDEFSLAGHRFNIRTLNTDAMLEVGLWVKKYGGSVAESRSYTAAVVAASVELLDGRPLYRPLGPTSDDFDQRVVVVRKWYPWTIDAIYSRCLALENRVNELLGVLGKASS